MPRVLPVNPHPIPPQAGCVTSTALCPPFYTELLSLSHFWVKSAVKLPLQQPLEVIQLGGVFGEVLTNTDKNSSGY